MASFFADFSTFSSWLGTKTESELKSKLYRADSGARLNGSKPDLVRRLVETTRHLGTERQLNIFPELRRRLHQNDLARAAAAFRQARQHVEDSRTDVSSAATHRQGMSNTRLIATTTSRLINNSSGRPVPTFNSSFRRPLTIPVSPHLGPQHPRGSTLQPQVVRHPHSSIFTGLCLVYAIKHNGLWLNTILCINANYLCFTLHSKHSHLFYCLFTGGERTPEQMLRETLEIQAGLIIQSISQAATPRIRQLSLSRMGASATASPVPARPRAASTSSAEKRGPEVSLEEDDLKVKLECKICFDSRVNTVLLPCGHACCCQDCSVRLKFATWDSKCPICRSRIQSISMLYFS